MSVKKKIIKIIQRKSKSIDSSRITNDTVAEHREQILAGGRRFKYPIQYARHKLVINTIIVSIAFIIITAVLGWWQLYIVQNSGNFIYKLTKIIPVPVAMVDGTSVPFSDYLVQYRGSEYYLDNFGEIKLNSNDGKVQLEYIKQQALNKAEQITYAKIIAKDLKTTITKQDIDNFIKQERNTANGEVSQETYDSSMKLYYGEEVSDYRTRIADSLLKTKISFLIDSKAKERAMDVEHLIGSISDFGEVVKKVSESGGDGITMGQTGLLDKSSKFNGLRISAVAKLEVGKTSGMLYSTTDDGYYFVRVLDKSGTKVNFMYIHIPLTKFKQDFENIKEDNKITEYIKIGNNNGQENV